MRRWSAVVLGSKFRTVKGALSLEVFFSSVFERVMDRTPFIPAAYLLPNRSLEFRSACLVRDAFLWDRFHLGG